MVLQAVMRLLSEDARDVEHHLPRLVQLVEDALTKEEWRSLVDPGTREALVSFVREEGPALPEMYRREALRAFMLARNIHPRRIRSP